MRETVRALYEQQLLPRYQALSYRDQRMLLILAAFLAVALPLFGLILPLHDRVEQAGAYLIKVKSEAAEAKLLADRMQQGGAKRAGGNVMSTVDRLARSSGVRSFMTRIRPQPISGGSEALTVQMKDVPYRETIAFLEALAKAGLGLSQLKLQSADSPGHIHVQAVITGG